MSDRNTTLGRDSGNLTMTDKECACVSDGVECKMMREGSVVQIRLGDVHDKLENPTTVHALVNKTDPIPH